MSMSILLRLGGFPGGSVVKNPPANERECWRHGFNPWVKKTPWRRKWDAIPAFLPGEFHGQRSPAGCSPRVRQESDMPEQLALFVEGHEAYKGILPRVSCFS